MDDFTRVNKFRLTVVVVLYKTGLNQSETLASIRNQRPCNLQVSVVLWDNSPERMEGINSFSGSLPFPLKYNHTPENLSLSKLYNRVISSESFDYILLLDQDTKLPENYFELIEELTTRNKTVNLFLPVVKNGERMVSPGHFRYFKGTHLASIEPGLCSSKNKLAVASGMVISQKTFSEDKLRFDERLNLYGIDSKFMLDYAHTQPSLYVMPVTLKHNSALWSNPSADELLPRFRNLRKAWSILLSDQPIIKLLNTIYYTIKSVMFSIKFRDSRFLR